MVLRRRDLSLVRRAATHARDAVAKRDDRIRSARRKGHTLAAIADAAGLTRQRIHQLTSTKPSTGGESND